MLNDNSIKIKFGKNRNEQMVNKKYDSKTGKLKKTTIDMNFVAQWDEALQKAMGEIKDSKAHYNGFEVLMHEIVEAYYGHKGMKGDEPHKEAVEFNNEWRVENGMYGIGGGGSDTKFGGSGRIVIVDGITEYHYFTNFSKSGFETSVEIKDNPMREKR